MPTPFPISSSYVIPPGLGVQAPFLAVTTGSSTITVTLPSLAGYQSAPPWKVTVRKVDGGAGTVNLVTSDGSTVDGVTGTTGITTPATQHAGFTVEPHVSFVLSGSPPVVVYVPSWWVTGT